MTTSISASSKSVSARRILPYLVGATACAIALLLPLKATLLIVAASLVVLYIMSTLGSTPDHQSGQPYVQMVSNTKYGRRNIRLCLKKALDIPGRYDVYLVTGGGDLGLHWCLLVKMIRRDVHLPYLSIDLTTDDDWEHFIPTMSQFSELPTSATSKGFVDISIKDLCEMADTIRSKMGRFDLTSRNCQTFCNELLKEMNLPTETTTFEEFQSVTTQGLKFLQNIFSEGN